MNTRLIIGIVLVLLGVLVLVAPTLLTIIVGLALILGVWAVCGLACMFIAWLSLRTIRRAREWVPPVAKTSSAPSKRVDEKPITWNQ